MKTCEKLMAAVFMAGVCGTHALATAQTPTLVVGGQNGIVGGLFLDGNTLYFNNSHGGRSGTDIIKSVSISGGSVTTVVTIDSGHTSDGSSSSILIDDTNLYGFVGGYAPGYLWTAPKNTVNGTPTYLTTVYGGGMLAQDSTRIFLTSGFGSIYTMPKDGSGGLSGFGGSVGWIRGNASDGQYLYTQDYFSRNYYKTDMSTGATSSLNISGSHEFGAFTDADYLYFSNKNDSSDDIQQYTKDGVFVQTLVESGVAWASGSDGSNVYYYNSLTQSIDSVPVVGGDSTVLFSIPQIHLGSFTVSNNVLYYVDKSGGANDHRIYSLNLASVPEPGTLSILGLGVAGLLLTSKSSVRKSN